MTGKAFWMLAAKRNQSEKTHPMGDSKGKKQKAKAQKQNEAKHTQAQQQKQAKQQPKTP